MKELMINNLPEEFAEIADILQLKEQMIGDYSVKAVDGRSLQSVLDSTKDHTTWAKVQVKRLGLVEKVDFEIVTTEGEPVKNPKNGNFSHYAPVKSYLFSIDAAKFVAVSSQAANGHLVRKYFLYMEKTAQKAVRGELPARSVPQLETPTVIAAREASEAALALSSAVSQIWGAGYVQKMTHEIFQATDVKYSTDIAKFLPLPEANAEQLSTLNPNEGQHLLRSSMGSKEFNMTEMSEYFNVLRGGVTPLNNALTELGYQKPLYSGSRKSGYTLIKEGYASTTALSTGKNLGREVVRIWYLNMFTQQERDTIKAYLLKHSPKSLR